MGDILMSKVVHFSTDFWYIFRPPFTLWFAKSMTWLQARFAIIAAAYNFVRPHSSLGTAKQPVTPAMAAGITKNPWSMSYLLGLPMLC
jgi:hypothetical protein